MTYGCRVFSSETEAFEKDIHCFGPGRSNTALGSSPSRDRLRISSPPEDLQGKTDISEPSHYHRKCNQNKKMTIPAFIILILPSKSLAEDRRYNWILKSCENTAQIFGSGIQEKSRAV